MGFHFENLHQQKWILLGIFSIAILYFWIKPVCDAVILNSDIKHSLEHQYENNKTLIQQKTKTVIQYNKNDLQYTNIIPSKNKDIFVADFLKKILSFSEVQGLFLQNFFELPQMSENTIEAQLELKGGLVNMLDFLGNLMQRERFVTIEKLSYKMDSASLGSISLVMKTLCVGTNYFMFEGEDNTTFYRFDVSYQKIKWVGYVVDEKHRFILAKFPNGKIVLLNEHAFVGREHAEILNFDKDKIILKIKTQKIIIPFYP